MNQENMVSIIIPVYNAEKYLHRCVDSVLKQTYQNLEILLIDDGSKDGSGAICDEYAAQDCRVRVIHKENTGVSDTRNVGLDEAKGDYILFIDSDDYIEDVMVERLLCRALKDNSDIVMCRYCVDRAGTVSSINMRYRDEYVGFEDIKSGLLYLYYTDYHTGLYSLWNKLIKKSVYSTDGIRFDTTLKRGEDAWFVFQCLKRCNRVAYINEPYYYYYQNPSSVMHTVYEDQFEKWVDMRKRLLKENESLGLKIDFNLFYREFLYKTVIYCKDLFASHNRQRAEEIMGDTDFKMAARNRKGLPLHIRSVLVSGSIHPKLGVLVLRLWERK